MLCDNKPLTGQDGLYASAAWDGNTSEIILKVVNTTAKSVTHEIVLKSRKKLSADAKWVVLKSDKLTNINSFDHATDSANRSRNQVEREKAEYSV